MKHSSEELCILCDIFCFFLRKGLGNFGLVIRRFSVNPPDVQLLLARTRV